MIIDYTPAPVLAKMMREGTPDNRVRMVRGPIGSGKSTANAVELFRQAVAIPKCADGVRRSKFAVVRNTLPQLRTTCLPTIMTVFGQLAHWASSKSEVTFRFDDGDGMVESTWLLLPLDTPQNIQRLLSLELTGAWVSEFREISPELVDNIYSRCGRFPSRMQLDWYYYFLIGETNSFDEDSEWNDKLEINLPGNWAYYVQPSAVTVYDDYTFKVTGENQEHLQPDYYNDLINGNGGLDAPWVKQYILNEIAPSVSGEAVFTQSFIRAFHTTGYEKELKPIDLLPLCIGLDTGRHPAAFISQIDPAGKFLGLGEACEENCGMEKFLNETLIPLLHTERFSGLPLYAVVDPAGRQRSQIGEESVVECIERAGIPCIVAQTNAIDPRLRAVEKLLARQIGGEAAFILDSVHCPKTVMAMHSKYRYKRRKNDNELQPAPDKTHPWSDLGDAVQYACLGGSTRIRAKALRKLNPPSSSNGDPVIGVEAWT